jgi:hypothetical protein
MARHNFSWRIAITAASALCILASNSSIAFGQYTWVQDSDSVGDWSDAANWLDGGSNTTSPNGIGVTAQINQRIWGGVAGTYTLDMPATDVTLGQLTIDNTNDDYAHKFNMINHGGRLIFEDPSGTAKYIETANGTPGDAPPNVQNSIQVPIWVKSTLEITQDNYKNLNTGTIFTNRFDGDFNSKIVKKGLGGIQFNLNSAPGAGFGFFGQIFIEAGAIRTINKTFSLASTSGITVSPGGQLILGDNGGTPVPDYNLGLDSLGNPAVLNLSGTGTNSGSGTAEGALRFDINTAQAPQPRTVTFHNPVVLQGDTTISANGANNTGVLEKPITGPFSLTKSGLGKLVIMDPLSLWNGDTHINSAATGGNSVLSLNNPILADGKDLYLSATRSALDLNFTGTDTIRSFFIDNVEQATGVWAATAGPGVDHVSSLITGNGLLNVTGAVVGVPGDYNNNGSVDAADYVLWRDGGPLQNEVDAPGIVNAQDFLEWRSRFGNPGSGSGLGNSAAVPEPVTAALMAFALTAVVAAAYRKR